MPNFTNNVKTRIKTGLFFAAFIPMIFFVIFIIQALYSIYSAKFTHQPFWHSLLPEITTEGEFIALPFFFIVLCLGFFFSNYLFKHLGKPKKAVIFYLGLLSSFLSLLFFNVFFSLLLACIGYFSTYSETLHQGIHGYDSIYDALLATGSIFLLSSAVSFPIGGLIGTPVAILSMFLFKKLVVEKSHSR